MNNNQSKYDSWEYFLLRAAMELSLSEAQYQKIESRYKQLQKILDVTDNPLLKDAHIFIQGSMRLKTTIKPAPGAPEELDTIDADAIIWLPHAQGAKAQEVLEIIEERFQKGSRVQANIKQLRRGIRIIYADEDPGFHIDVTPARAIRGNPQDNGEGNLEVPDRETGWKASSPIPYANWLEKASQQFISFAESQHLSCEAATQEPLPHYQDYLEDNPLRATIKLLKRHRDEWAIRTKNEKYRPISAIITTLAALAYLEIVEEPQSTPLRPLDAIIRIVQKMTKFIDVRGSEYFVCNPEDPGENFAEKWNRQGDGQFYYQTFQQWHKNAITSMSLGLESFSAKDFAEALTKSFGMAQDFITEVNNMIPVDWTLPGRPDGITRNSTTMNALFGGTSATAGSQADVQPVGRLG